MSDVPYTPNSFRGIGLPPGLYVCLRDGIMCQDPECYRPGQHCPREYGCKWNDLAQCNADGTITILKDEAGNELDPPQVKAGWF